MWISDIVLIASIQSQFLTVDKNSLLYDSDINVVVNIVHVTRNNLSPTRTVANDLQLQFQSFEAIVTWGYFSSSDSSGKNLKWIQLDLADTVSL